jgi:transposase
MCSEGGLPLIDCPADYGPSTTVYNRFNRWSHRGFWVKLPSATWTPPHRNCRPKDSRRVLTTKLAPNFLSGVALATARGLLAVNESEP